MNNQTTEFQLFAHGSRKEIKEALVQYVGVDDNKIINYIVHIFGYKNVSELINGKNDMDPEKVNEVNVVFQKIFKTMAYVNFAENAFVYKNITGQKIQKMGSVDEDGDETRESVSWANNPKQIQEHLQDMIDHPEDYRVEKKGSYQTIFDIQKDFKSKKIRDIANLHISNQDIQQSNTELYEEIKDINNDRAAYQQKIDQ
ncbi:MAG: hypothetical protein GXP45_05625 [bacterium]|nr:hypothetical protein [bacterium]